MRAIVRAVARYYGADPVHLLGVRRSDPAVVRARQVAHHLAVQLTARSLPEIGRAMNRHHATIMHSDRVVRARMDVEPELARAVEILSTALCAAADLGALAALVAALDHLAPGDLLDALRAEVERLDGAWMSGFADEPSVRRHLYVIELRQVVGSGLGPIPAAIAWRAAARRAVNTTSERSVTA